jgi:shikimate dehydrogenase
MNTHDAMPMDLTRREPDIFVGKVVLTTTMTPYLYAAQAHGCHLHTGSNMLFEQIPLYLEYFGLPATTAEHLCSLAHK